MTGRPAEAIPSFAGVRFAKRFVHSPGWMHPATAGAASSAAGLAVGSGPGAVAIEDERVDIEFPILLYLNKRIIVLPEEGARVLGMRFADERTMLMASSAKKGDDDVEGWMIDSRGDYFELVPVRRRNEWASFFSPIVQLVKSEFRVSPPSRISVRDLLGKVDGIRDGSREAPIAKDLRRHLRNYDESGIVTSDVLRSWPM